MIGTLVTILIVILILGLIFWAINALLPIDPKFKTVIYIILLIITILILCSYFGVWGGDWGVHRRY